MAIIALYRMNGNVLDSANGNNGTPHSITYSEGKENQGAVLNGSNGYVDVGIPSQTSNTDFTMRATFKRLGNGNGAFNAITQMQNGSSIARFGLWLDSSNVIRVFNSDGTFVSTGISCDLNKYDEYVLDRTSSAMTLWKNGNPVFSVASSNNDGALPINFFRIGCRENVAEFVNGLIDTVEILNSVLSPAEKKNRFAFANGFI